MSEAPQGHGGCVKTYYQALFISLAVKGPVAFIAFQIMLKREKAWFRPTPSALPGSPSALPSGHTGLLPPHSMSPVRRCLGVFALAVSSAKELFHSTLGGAGSFEPVRTPTETPLPQRGLPCPHDLKQLLALLVWLFLSLSL